LVASNSTEKIRHFLFPQPSGHDPPDGKKIVFSRLVPDPDPTKPGRQQVFTMNADGTDQTQLTLFDEGVNGGPSWGALWIGGGGPK
jgi:Tol biopolymer transport system component